MVPEDVFEDCCSTEDELFEDCAAGHLASSTEPAAADGRVQVAEQRYGAADILVGTADGVAGAGSHSCGTVQPQNSGDTADNCPGAAAATAADQRAAAVGGDECAANVAVERTSDLEREQQTVAWADRQLMSETAGGDSCPVTDSEAEECGAALSTTVDVGEAVAGVAEVRVPPMVPERSVLVSDSDESGSDGVSVIPGGETGDGVIGSSSAEAALGCDVSPTDGGDWHLLEQHSPAAVGPADVRTAFTAASAAQDLSETLAEAHASADVVAEAAGDAADEPELVTDPDAVDEEQLQQLDLSQTQEQRQQRAEQAAALKADGNQLFSCAAFDTARERYTAALRLCPLACSRQRAVLFSNRAACRAHAADETGAVSDCSRSLELDPEYVKPLQRRAELLYRQEKLDESLADWKRLLELQPTHAEARRAVAALPGEIHQRNEKLKIEMFAKLKDLGNMILRPFNLSTDNFQMEQGESGGYSVKFNPT